MQFLSYICSLNLRYYEHEGENSRFAEVDAGAGIVRLCSAGKRPACE